MRLTKSILYLLLIYSFESSSNASTEIKCSNQNGKMITRVAFSSNPVKIVFDTEFDGMKLSPYIFLNETTACGQPIESTTSCKNNELKDSANIGNYDFSFSCTDGRNGSLHYEAGTVLAYCYSNTTNQRASENCEITY